MIYEDLHALLMNNDECREYFLKLPVWAQLTAHQQNDEIKTEEQLREYIDLMTKMKPRG